MSGRVKTILGALAPLLIGVAGYVALISMKEPPPKKEALVLRALNTLPLKRELISPRVVCFANVTSSSDILISAEVSGKIVHCHPELTDGGVVAKGDVLAKIEDDDYEIAVDMAEAELGALESDAKRTERNIRDLKQMLLIVERDFKLEEKNYNRVKALFDKKVTSQSEMERARQAMSRRNKIYIEMSNNLSKSKFYLEILRNRVKSARAKLRQAKLNLSRTVIKAPISGRVDNCSIDDDEYIRAGEPICSIKVDSRPELAVSINAKDFARVLGIKPDAARHWFDLPNDIKTTAAWVEAPKRCRWSLELVRVTRYDPKTDTVSLLTRARKYAGTDPAPYPLVPGMFCKVVFEAPPIKAFRIPFSALQIGDCVYTVDGDGVLHRHEVVPFYVEGESVIIKSGLPDGERVVSQQMPRGLLEGMRVKVVSSESR